MARKIYLRCIIVRMIRLEVHYSDKAPELQQHNFPGQIGPYSYSTFSDN